MTVIRAASLQEHPEHSFPEATANAAELHCRHALGTGISSVIIETRVFSLVCIEFLSLAKSYWLKHT